MQPIPHDQAAAFRDSLRALIASNYRLGPDAVLGVLEDVMRDVRQWRIEGWQAADD